MHWLDPVLAVPAVGVRLKPRLHSATDHFAIMSRVVDELVDQTGDAQLGSNDPTSLEFKTPDGFSHSVTMDNLVVQFAYTMPKRRKAGTLPVFETPRQQAYSDLLKTSLERLLLMLKYFEPRHQFVVNRIGVLTATRLPKEPLPPGVADWIKRLRSQWKEPVIKIESNFVLKLSTGEGFHDQCHHVLNLDETVGENPDEVHVKLDWQRIFEPEKNLEFGEVSSLLGELKTKALGYFQQVGTGGDLQ